MITSSRNKLLFLALLLVFTTGCSAIDPAGLGTWASVATLPLPSGIFESLFLIIGEISVVFAAAWFFYSDREGRRAKVSIFIIVSGLLSLVSVILSFLAREFWPEEYSFSYIWNQMGWPSLLPIVIAAIGYTIMSAILHLGVQIFIVLGTAKDLLVASRHFEPEILLGPLGFAVGWFLFPPAHYEVVGFIGTLDINLFSGWKIDFPIIKTTLYLLLTFGLQAGCYIYLPREFSRRTTRWLQRSEQERLSEKVQSENRERISAEDLALVFGTLAALGWRGPQGSDSGSQDFGNGTSGSGPTDPRRLPPGSTNNPRGGNIGQGGNAPSTNGPGGQNPKKSWERTSGTRFDSAGGMSIAWKDSDGDFQFFPDGVNPNLTQKTDDQKRVDLPEATPLEFSTDGGTTNDSPAQNANIDSQSFGPSGVPGVGNQAPDQGRSLPPSTPAEFTNTLNQQFPEQKSDSPGIYRTASTAALVTGHPEIAAGAVALGELDQALRDTGIPDPARKLPGQIKKSFGQITGGTRPPVTPDEFRTEGS